MVSTNGYGPKMAGLVRKRIADSLPPRLGEAIGKVGVLRKRLRGIVPEQEESGKRMKWYGFFFFFPILRFYLGSVFDIVFWVLLCYALLGVGQFTFDPHARNTTRICFWLRSVVILQG